MRRPAFSVFDRTMTPIADSLYPARDPMPDGLRRRVCCIVPCFNVGQACAPVIRECARHTGIVVAVNDGSTDSTADVLRRLERELAGRLRVLTLVQNQGKGAALMKGFAYFLEQTDCDAAVTLDGDGQHRPGDIPCIAGPCLQGNADLVIAQRQFPRDIPARSRLGNNVSTALFTGVYRHAPRDTQCGLRAHGRGFVEAFFPCVAGRRYETEARILMLALRWGRRIAQAPVPAIYHGRNESSHFRLLWDSLRIFRTFLATVLLPDTGISELWHNQKGVRSGNTTSIVTRPSRPCVLDETQNRSIFSTLKPSARAGRPCHIKGSEFTNGVSSLDRNVGRT